MATKAPSFQFYPGDWLTNAKLQACSLKAQGLLVNLMCLMHQSTKYGYLLIGGSIPPQRTLNKLLRIHYKTYQSALKELISYDVLKMDKDGVIYCERMIKDEHFREVRRKAGKLGGNPLLIQQVNQKGGRLVKQEVNQEVKVEVKRKTTPSSPSSSSSLDLSKDKSKINQPDIDFDKGKKKKKTPPAAHADLSKKDLKKTSNHFSEKVGDFFESILKSCEIISKLPQKKKLPFNPYQFVQKHVNEKRHPGVIDETLKAVSKYWDGIRGDIYTYANAIVKTKNKNWNEKEAIAIHNELKKMDVPMLNELTSGLFKML